MTEPVSKWHWSVWLRGLAAALVSGVATGALGVLAIPEAVTVAAPGVLLKMAAIGAGVGLFGYLKQSPLPAEDGP
jgi:xanthine/uracil/vitamin C permease (AzgA family)